MPTSLDRAMNSKNLFLGFVGMVTAAAVWSIWGNEMFPAEDDPKGGKYPSTWTLEEMRRWLRARGLMPDRKATREELLERIRANLRYQPKSPE
ncbi:Ish1 domain-containing protein [Aspergillus mulundensis]|uniref:STE24 endopeptidase n=1 Tax=Aspergillus mulundensis TaxID=1810919 RepID=A0A3D8T5Y9_9EURO|nr:Uncharacterized protein DSM5745_01173 [Aspergillus mulundensis]RDW93851.1 Uncharacterized protein DSM5745_01173 [Aspergillus mulundensis]